MVLQRDWNMTLFLKGFTVLLIITLSATSASSDPNITLSGNCQLNLTAECAMDFLDRILNISAEELHQEMVEGYLNTITTLMTSVMNTVTDEEDLIRFGDSVLNVNEKLASKLLRKTETFNLTSSFLRMLEVQVFQVGPAAADTYLSEVLQALQLQMSNVTMDIDLSEILNENNGSAAVGLISYSNMAKILKPSLFNTSADEENILVSSVVSAVLPKTSNTQLTRAANFTFKHNTEFSITDPLYCVYWDSSQWVESGCDVTRINTTHTECSCSHLSTFALIRQTNFLQSYVPIRNPALKKFIKVFLILSIVVGLVCLSLSILTFAVCRTNTVLINLCTNIWLFDLIQTVRFFSPDFIYSHKILVAVLAAGKHFLQLSIFMWMFLEIVVLYIFVKNLSKITLKKTKVPNWKWLVLIGYSFPLVLIVLTAALTPCECINVLCWRYDFSILMYTFYGSLFLLIIINTVIFMVLIVHLIVTLIRLRNENVQMNNMVDKKLMISVVLKSLAQFFIIVFPMIGTIFLEMPVSDFAWGLVTYFFYYQQGTFIFLVHCVFNQKVREKYKQILGACCRRNTPNIRTDVQDVQQTVRTSVNSFLEKLGRFVKRK